MRLLPRSQAATPPYGRRRAGVMSSDDESAGIDPWLPLIGVAAASAAGVYPAPHNVTDLPLPGPDALAHGRRPVMAPRHRRGVRAHGGLVFLQRLLEAIRHVRTGGASTRARARRRAAAPPKKCRTCGQRLPHSSDYRDHLH